MSLGLRRCLSLVVVMETGDGFGYMNRVLAGEGCNLGFREPPIPVSLKCLPKKFKHSIIRFE